jgi:hypothetical protein
MFWFMLTCYRYDQALAAVLAIEHYLEGPGQVFSNIGDRHQRVLKELSQYHPEVSTLDKYVWLDSNPSERFASFLPPIIRTIVCAWWLYIIPARESDKGKLNIRLIEPAHHHPLYVYGDNVVCVWLSYSNAVLTFRKDIRKSWRLTKRFLTAMFLWRINAQGIAKKYKEESYRHSKMEAWLRLLQAESSREVLQGEKFAKAAKHCEAAE